MLRKLTLLLFCGVLVGLFSLNGFDAKYDVVLADAASGDGTQPIDYGGLSTQRPLSKNETVFVTDVGGDLDKYLYRDDLQATNGRLSFAIDIDRYYSTWIADDIDSTTWLLPPEAIAELVSNNLLPPIATLTLEVFDVDPDAVCSEIDQVYLNSIPIYNRYSQGDVANLSSGHDAWNTWAVEFPINYLRLPWQPGQNGQRPSALNSVAIDVNTDCGHIDWAVKVDWGAITIENTSRRPVVFVHGWRGDETTFTSFQSFTRDQSGLPTLKQFNIGVTGTLTLATILDLMTLPTKVDEARTQFGVDKVDLFAHSKGGIVSRLHLEDDAFAAKVDKLLTFGSPHHGNDSVLPVGAIFCPIEFDGTGAWNCYASALELTNFGMMNWNYQGCRGKDKRREVLAVWNQNQRLSNERQQAK